jgi:lipopolysaccharide transport system ATP-binding protein
MHAIRSLCDSAIQIDAGRIVNAGAADEVVTDYLSRHADTGASIVWEQGRGPGDEEVRLVCVEVLHGSGKIAPLVTSTEPFSLRMELDITRLHEALCIGFDLIAPDGAVVLRTYQTDASPDRWPQLHVGRNSIACTIPAGLLNDGRYYVMPRVGLYCVRWIVPGETVVAFEVRRDPGASPYAVTSRPGTVAPILDWRTA